MWSFIRGFTVSVHHRILIIVILRQPFFPKSAIRLHHGNMEGRVSKNVISKKRWSFIGGFAVSAYHHILIIVILKPPFLLDLQSDDIIYYDFCVSLSAVGQSWAHCPRHCWQTGWTCQEISVKLIWMLWIKTSAWPRPWPCPITSSTPTTATTVVMPTGVSVLQTTHHGKADLPLRPGCQYSLPRRLNQAFQRLFQNLERTVTALPMGGKFLPGTSTLGIWQNMQEQTALRSRSSKLSPSSLLFFLLFFFLSFSSQSLQIGKVTCDLVGLWVVVGWIVFHPAMTCVTDWVLHIKWESKQVSQTVNQVCTWDLMNFSVMLIEPLCFTGHDTLSHWLQ